MGVITLTQRDFASKSDLVINEAITNDDYISLTVSQSDVHCPPQSTKSRVLLSDQSYLSRRIINTLSQIRPVGDNSSIYIIETPHHRITISDGSSLIGYEWVNESNRVINLSEYNHHGLSITTSQFGFQVRYRHVVITNNYYFNDDETINFANGILLRMKTRDD
jgi:hypothetical protein